MSLPNFLTHCADGPKQPNIIFIMSDDHAEQAISCYGSKLISTPNIDRIAKEGILFRNSFVTNSICGPSRATMLTGKYSHVNGLRDNRDEFDGTQMTFPKLLQKAGYQTAIFGKWHLKTTPTGFDKWKILIGQGQYYNPDFIEPDGTKRYEGYTTDIITENAIDFLDERDKTKPFCMLVHHKAPHRNWMPAARHLGAFDDKDIPLPESFYDDYKTREETAGHADMRIEDMFLSFDMKLQPGDYKKETGTGGNKKWAQSVPETWENTYKRMTPEQKAKWDAHYDKINAEFRNSNLKGKELLEWKYRRYMRDYLSCILAVDENVGRVLDYLDTNGLKDDTIIVYTSDQGFYLGEHGWYDKRFMYEESLGMPLVMRYPREIKAGQETDKMVLNLDFAPTFLDFTGVPVPTEMQGESFRSIVADKKAADWRKSIYYHYYEYPHGWHKVHKHCGVRTDKYKLIHFYDIDKWELYDLENDENEYNNLYDNSEYQQVVDKLKKELKKLQAKYKDTSFETST